MKRIIACVLVLIIAVVSLCGCDEDPNDMKTSYEDFKDALTDIE